MKKKIRILSLIISVALIFGCVAPLTAFAAGDAQENVFSGIENTDKINDLGVGLDTKGDGIMSAAQLSTIEGVKVLQTGKDADGNIAGAENDNYCNHSFSTDTKNFVKATSDGLEYWKLISTTNPESTVIDYFYYDISMLEAVKSDAGKSFVYSFNLKISEAPAEKYNLLGMCNNGQWLSPITYLELETSGQITYRTVDEDGINTSTVTTTEAYITPDNQSYTNIAMHIKPSVGEGGLYSLYIDGKLAAKDVRLFTSSEKAASVLTSGDTSYEFLPSTFYLFQSVIKNTAGSFLLHTPKLYYSEDFVECSEHSFDYAGHTHGEGGSTAVTFTCHCGKSVTTDATLELLKASLDNSGNGLMSADELKNIAGVEVLQTGKDSDGIIKNGTSNYENHSFSYDTQNFTIVNDGGFEYWKSNKNNAYVVDYFYWESNLRNASKDDAGKSFVYSFNLKFDEAIARRYTLLQMCNSGQYTNPITYLELEKSGQITYRVVNENGVSTSTQTTADAYISHENQDYINIAMHIRPEEGEGGLYSLYIDGKLAVKDVRLFTSSEKAASMWTLNNTTYGFVPSTFYLFRNLIENTAGSVKLHTPILYYSEEYVECPKHNFDYIGNTDAGDKAIFACHCGKTEEVTLPTVGAESNGSCEICGGHYLTNDGKAVVTKRNVVLNEMLSLKLYAKVASDIIENAKMVVEFDGKTEKFVISEMTPIGGEYIFETKLSSIDMSKNIEMYIEVDGVKSENTYTTSVRDYLETLMNTSKNESEKSLCIATLNYGAYAQGYFAEKKSDAAINADLANKNLKDAEKSVASVTAEVLAANKVIVSGNATDTNFVGATLVCDSKLSMKIFFTSETFASVSGADTDATASDGMYFVEIKDLLPTDLDEPYTITVTNAAGETKTATLSVISALNALLNSDASTAFKDLGRAIYLYNKAADAYVA